IALTVSWHYLQDELACRAQANFQGPFDWDGAWSDAFDGLIHGSLLALILAGLLWMARRSPRDRRVLQMAALAVTAIDLAAAQQHLFDYAPAALWTNPIEFA